MVDILHGGFDLLLTAGVQDFNIWLNESRAEIQKVLDQRAATVWREYVSAASRFPAIRIKSMDGRRRREMSRRTRDRTRMDTRHWEQMLERRVALELVREAMAAELRVLRQDKYGWILHAESGWVDHLQQLVHERAIWPIVPEVLDEEPDWQLCPTEGPYRMRKKLERRKRKLNALGKPHLMVHISTIRARVLIIPCEDHISICCDYPHSVVHLFSWFYRSCHGAEGFQSIHYKEITC